MKKLLRAFVAGTLSISALCAASSAHAVVTIPCPSGTISQGCSFDDSVGSGTFYDTIIKSGVSTSFDDIFKVVLNSPGDVTLTLTSSPFGISFSSLKFDGANFAFGTAGTTFTKAAGTYDLQVAGSVTRNASFAGTIDFTSAVPEPATWAMMIGGFAVVGFTLRRRRSKLMGTLATA